MLLKGRVVRHFRALSIEAFKSIYKIRHMGAFSPEITAPVTELQSSPDASSVVVPRPATLPRRRKSSLSDFPTNALLKWAVGFRQSVLTNEKNEFMRTKSLQVIIFLKEETLPL